MVAFFLGAHCRKYFKFLAFSSFQRLTTSLSMAPFSVLKSMNVTIIKYQSLSYSNAVVTSCSLNLTILPSHKDTCNQIGSIQIIQENLFITRSLMITSAIFLLPFDVGSISGSGRLPGEGNGNPLQYSYLENARDRGTRQATVHGITKNRI